jgi:K+-sensing histidine kinase KdpD
MTKAIDNALWKIPRWLHYGIAVGLALVAIYLRLLLQPTLMHASPLAFALFALCISAYMGGFWPGVLCGVIGFAGSIYLFVEPRYSISVKDPAMGNQMAITFALGIFICFIAGRLRDQARQNAMLAEQLDIDRTQSQDILDSITDAFYAVNKDWMVLQTNPAFVARVPHRTKVVPGVNLWDSYPELEEPKMKKMLTRNIMKTRMKKNTDVV